MSDNEDDGVSGGRSDTSGSETDTSPTSDRSPKTSGASESSRRPNVSDSDSEPEPDEERNLSEERSAPFEEASGPLASVPGDSSSGASRNGRPLSRSGSEDASVPSSVVESRDDSESITDIDVNSDFDVASPPPDGKESSVSGSGTPGGLFDDLLSGEPIFENKEVLRPSYTPRNLPHREDQINATATILVAALRGETPSNILIYGKTGTGKTASAKYVSQELESTSQRYDVPCTVEYINCEVTDTQYRVLARLANSFIESNEAYIDSRTTALEDLRERVRDGTASVESTQFDSIAAIDERIDALEADQEGFEPAPMTGWPTDRVYSTFFEAVDYRERVVVIMLDEIDKLVEKSGDDTLYNLSRMNSGLENSRVSIMGISNDLKFTDFLDPRVKSSLGEEEIVFPPYDANQLRDILAHRAEMAFEDGALTEDVIPLCAAFAAQEHGDARRALDLLRTAGELAERSGADRVEGEHVRRAQEKIELDRVVEVVRTLPTQSKLVLFAIILLENNGVHNITTGEAYNIYRRLCEEIDADVLTQRRVTDLISELDMLGIVNAIVVSKGRYGRTKEISLSVPTDKTRNVLLSDSRLSDLQDVKPFVQSRFDEE